MIPRSVVAVLAVSIALLPACGGSDAVAPDNTVASVAVSPASANLTVGQTLQLEATARTAAQEVIQAPVSWASEAPGVATVDDIGLVTAVSAGAARIVAEVEGVTGGADLTVVLPPDPSEPPAAYVTSSWTDEVAALTSAHEVGYRIPTGENPQSVAFSPDGATAYVVAYSDDEVTVIDVELSIVSGSIPVGDSPVFVAFSPDGAHAWVANWGSGDISIIDVGVGAVSQTLSTGAAPNAIAFSPDGSVAHVAQQQMDGTNRTGELLVIDVQSASISQTISFSDPARAAAFSPDGALGYVTVGDFVVVVDPASGAPQDSIDIGGISSSIALTPDGSLLYAANTGTGEATVVDLASGEVQASLPVAGTGTVRSVAFSLDGSRAFVTNSGSSNEGAGLPPTGMLTVIDVANTSVMDSVAIAGASGIAMRPGS